MKKKTFSRLNKDAAENSSPIQLSGVDLLMLQTAYKTAKTSEYTKFPLAALVAQRGKMIAVGTNKKKSHPKQASYYRPHHGPERLSTHAELITLITAQRSPDFKPHKATLYVARVGGGPKALRCTESETPACSYPCEQCWRMINHLGIHRIVCYNEHGKPVEIYP